MKKVSHTKSTEIICILCPNGCELEVRHSGEPTPETIEVEGNLCPRGIDYAVEEILHPKRSLTTSILVRGGTEPQASVKTAGAFGATGLKSRLRKAAPSGMATKRTARSTMSGYPLSSLTWLPSSVR